MVVTAAPEARARARNREYCALAGSSKDRTRSPNAGNTSFSKRALNRSRRFPFGSTAIPTRISASVIVVT